MKRIATTGAVNSLGGFDIDGGAVVVLTPDEWRSLRKLHDACAAQGLALSDVLVNITYLLNSSQRVVELGQELRRMLIKESDE